MSNDSPPVHSFCLQGVRYVTVSVIAVRIGCDEKKKKDRGIVALGSCRRLKHNVCSITTEL